MSIPNSSSEHSIVRLNVGGTIIQTKKETLMPENDPFSFFHLLFSNEQLIETDEQGNVFIDRDPTLFLFILDLLRNGGTVNHELLQRIGLERLILLRTELEFFQFKQLAKEVNLYELHLNLMASQYKRYHNRKLMYSWKELTVKNTRYGISYLYKPFNFFRTILISLASMVLNLSDHQDNSTQFNYIELYWKEISYLSNIGIAPNGFSESLGSTRDSFAFSPYSVYNNGQIRSLDVNFKRGMLGVWFDAKRSNLVLYIKKGSKWKEVMLCEKCIIDASKSWSFYISLGDGNHVTLQTKAKHPLMFGKHSVIQQPQRKKHKGVHAEDNHLKSNKKKKKKQYRGKNHQSRMSKLFT